MIELRISGEPGGDQLLEGAVADLFLKLGVEASISATENVVSDPDWHRERGLLILLPRCDREVFVQRVWPALKESYQLRCGWMDASDKGFRGCTENYCRESICPARVTMETFERLD